MEGELEGGVEGGLAKERRRRSSDATRTTRRVAVVRKRGPGG